jgi:uncharacterized membrane protein YjjP (DUF1212 family)
VADADSSRAFVLKLGRALHRFGYPADRLDDDLALIGRRLGLQAQFFTTPTLILASFGAPEDQRTVQLRPDPPEINLEKLALLESVAERVAREALSVAEGAQQVDAVVEAAPRYGALLRTLCFSFASGTAARIFGGGWGEVALSAVVGLATGLLALVAQRLPALGRVFEPVAAILAGALATAAARSFGPVSAQVSIVSGLIVLIPGFTLTLAMTELATRNLVSGTARLASAVGTFLSIGVGVALGTALAGRLVGEPAAHFPVALPQWTLWLALVLTPLALTVLMRAHPRDAPWILAAGMLGFGGARAGAYLLGPELGTFVGALLLGIWSNGYARGLGRPAAVTLVPGLLLLVPGSIGFSSLTSLLDRQTLSGVEAAFRMTLVATSLVTGLLLSNVLVQPRALGARGG